jgi:hypothetical protein
MVTSVTNMTKGGMQKLPKKFKTVETNWHDHSLESFWGALSDGSISFWIFTVFDAAISRLMMSVHSNLVQSRQYALLKTTSQRYCISNVHNDTGYGLDAVTTQRGFASAGGHKHSAGLNTVWL